MSSILITSRLHRAWKRSTKQWAQEMRRVTGPEGGFTGTAPRPSQAVPPPEEFSTVLRSVLPYINHGVNAPVASAIIAAATAGQELPPSALLPISYYAGLGSGRSESGGLVCLTYSREWLGCPMVPMEDFPMSTMFGSDEVPPTLISFPSETHNKIVFSAWHGCNLFPKSFANPSELTEAEVRCVHPRELERIAPARGVFVKSIPSNLRYTGCVRPATDAEIDTLFDTILLPECWLKSDEFNFRDFFNAVGVDSSALSEAAEQAESVLRPATITVGASSPTDVPSPRRTRRATVDDLVMSPEPPNRSITASTPDGSVPVGYRMFTGATATVAPRPPRPSRRYGDAPAAPVRLDPTPPPAPITDHFAPSGEEATIDPGQ